MASETILPGDLIISDFPVETMPITIVSGAGELKRGTVIGMIAASRKYNQSLGASNDGSETPKAILAVDVDATASDVAAVAYRAGTFNEDKLILGAGITLDGVKAAFEDADAPIFIKSVK
ncbi:head decoration protein [Oricola thermophila]|uniref:Head decoration protein n=1 Tax=Oricola thermophila TaxID=2742145 RepID=A0A6N1VHD7_9HYPH|nr:head decoration protein [Oricola thermophila]QKV18722.1 head decoration protein [Oricola thermophila]